MALSFHVSIYSSSYDYSGSTLTYPIVLSLNKNIHQADVPLVHHFFVGSGSVVLPGIKFEMGLVAGALSHVTKNCILFLTCAGKAARYVKDIKRDLFELKKRLICKTAQI